MAEDRVAELARRVAELKAWLAQLLERQTQPTVLRAPVRVVDEAGAEVLTIERGHNFTAINFPVAGPGELALSIGAGSEGGGIAFGDAQGRLLAYLGMQPQGACLSLAGKPGDTQEQGVSEITIAATVDGGAITLNMPNGKTLALLSAKASVGQLILRDEEGNDLVALPPKT